MPTLTYDHRMLEARRRGDPVEVARVRELMRTSCRGCGNGPATADGSPCEHCDLD